MLFTGLPFQGTLGTVGHYLLGGGGCAVLLSSSWQGSMQPLQEHPRCFSVLTAMVTQACLSPATTVSSEAGGLQHPQVGD